MPTEREALLVWANGGEQLSDPASQIMSTTISTIARDATARSRSPVRRSVERDELPRSGLFRRTRSASSPSVQASRTRRTTAPAGSSRPPENVCRDHPTIPRVKVDSQVAVQIPRLIVPSRPMIVPAGRDELHPVQAQRPSRRIRREQRHNHDPGHDQRPHEQRSHRHVKREDPILEGHGEPLMPSARSARRRMARRSASGPLTEPSCICQALSKPESRCGEERVDLPQAAPSPATLMCSTSQKAGHALVRDEGAAADE